MMRALLVLSFCLASAHCKSLIQAAPPTEVEYGFCDGSPEPASLDKISIEPFPVIIQTGATITLDSQVTLNEEIVVGSRLSLSVTLEGIIPIKIPCLDIGGTNLGSCEYDVDELLGMVSVTGICEDYIPEGQACNLPLGPGVYGSGEPLVIPFNDVPDILAPFLKGVIRAEATFLTPSGDNFACVWIRVAVDH